MLKYKKSSEVFARLGNSVSRVGLFSALQGKRFAKNKIDFETNILDNGIKEVYRFVTVPKASGSLSNIEAISGGKKL